MRLVLPEQISDNTNSHWDKLDCKDRCGSELKEILRRIHLQVKLTFTLLTSMTASLPLNLKNQVKFVSYLSVKVRKDTDGISNAKIINVSLLPHSNQPK